MSTESAVLRICMVISLGPREVRSEELRLQSPYTVEQALKQAGVAGLIDVGADLSACVGVWGCRVAASHVLQQDDRLEVYRHLTVDPKLARRQRFIAQGSKTAGLFKKRRPNAKPGY